MYAQTEGERGCDLRTLTLKQEAIYSNFSIITGIISSRLSEANGIGGSPPRAFWIRIKAMIKVDFS